MHQSDPLHWAVLAMTYLIHIMCGSLVSAAMKSYVAIHVHSVMADHDSVLSATASLPMLPSIKMIPMSAIQRYRHSCSF